MGSNSLRRYGRDAARNTEDRSGQRNGAGNLGARRYPPGDAGPGEEKEDAQKCQPERGRSDARKTISDISPEGTHQESHGRHEGKHVLRKGKEDEWNDDPH